MMLIRPITFALVVLAAGASLAGAQGQFAAVDVRAPRFFIAQPSRAGSPIALDVRRTPVLMRRLSLDLDGVPLKRALAEISERAGLTLIYGDGVLPREKTVSLRAERITVVAALTDLLADLGVDVLFNPMGGATLVPRSQLQGVLAGSITGRVTDVVTGFALQGVQVYVDGNRQRTLSDTSGRYTLSDIPSGTHTLVAQRLGYARATQAVTVTDGVATTVDVLMRPVASQLNEMVVTATGRQRRVELGHVVGRIDADSLVREAPINSVTDLLMARSPGVLVQPNDGQVGVAGRVRIRGPNSAFGATTAPVVIVDGIRIEGFRQAAGANALNPEYEQGLFRVAAPSRLDNLNVNDIESVELIKGPSAATLYGPDAANGVIVITTKRGRPGAARWRAYARGALTDIPISKFPEEQWYGWSTNAAGQQNRFSCTLQRVAVGSCVQDSITKRAFNPLNDPKWSIYSSEPRWNYGANVSGGEEKIRYFLSADVENATGPLQMSRGHQEMLKERLGVNELPAEWKKPNHFQDLNLRGNLSTSVGNSTDLLLSTGYTRNVNRTSRVISSPWEGGFIGFTPVDNNPDPYGALGRSPADYFATTSTEHLRRWVASATAQWRPFAFLSGRAVAGFDLSDSRRVEISPRGVEAAIFSGTNGAIAEQRGQTGVYSLSLDATATAARDWLSSRTSVGAQWYRSLSQGLSGSKRDLLPVGETFAQASTVGTISQSHVELATLGSYVEQMIGIRDRLFLTAALRGDQASTFGQGVRLSVHPKASVSWLISEEPMVPRIAGLDEARLRVAFGSSLIQPPLDAARAEYSVSSGYAEGGTRGVARRRRHSNAELRPERVNELEFGVDATALQQRVKIELSWYRRRTNDWLQTVNLPPSLRAGLASSVFQNVGVISNNGFEALVDTRIVDSRAVSLNMTLAHSYYTTRLLDVGENAHPHWKLREGHPVDAAVASPFTFADTAGGAADGIIVSDEVTIGEGVVIGRIIPPRSQQLTTTLGLLNSQLRISALIDRQSGHVARDYQLYNVCQASYCRDMIDPSTPIERQAEAVSLFQTFSEWRTALQPADMTRLRELSVTARIPQRLLSRARLSDASVTMQARNLAVLSQSGHEGQDPESAIASGVTGIFSDGTRTLPQSRTIIIRLDLGF